MQAKAIKKPSRRRPRQGVTVEAADAEEKPFGACLHMDPIIMKHGSKAAAALKQALVLLDEKTKFVFAYPMKTREAGNVLNGVHQFEGPDLPVRRWWTDNAPEFAAAITVST